MEDAHGSVAITLIKVIQIDFFERAVVTDLQRAQAGDGLHRTDSPAGFCGRFSWLKLQSIPANPCARANSLS